MKCRRCNDGRYVWYVPKTGDMSSVPCPDCTPACRKCGAHFVPTVSRIFHCAACCLHALQAPVADRMRAVAKHLFSEPRQKGGGSESTNPVGCHGAKGNSSLGEK